MTPRRGNPDFILLFLTVGLVGFGLSMVSEASSIIALRDFGDAWFFARRQMMWAAIGLTIMLIIMNIPYQLYQKWFVWITLAAWATLIVVLIPGIGQVRNGAQGWLGIGALTFQPAEFAKLGILIYLAALITKKEQQFQDFKRGLLPSLIAVGMFTLLLILQPDFGGAIILLGGALVVVICGGANLKQLTFISIPMALLVLLMATLSEHVKSRFTSFLNPWADPYDSGYQLIQSLYAFANGGITGTGFGQSVGKYDYIIYPQNDFIFAIIAEEFGFIGVCLFFFIYLLFLWRALTVSLRSRDSFANLLGAGIVSMLAIQTLINIGGVTGAIPITGVTLPLISYGGSSLLVSLIGIGIILNISRTGNIKKT